MSTQGSREFTDINRHALEQFEINTDVFNKGGGLFF